MSFEATTKAQTFLSEYGKLVEDVDQAAFDTVQRKVINGQLSESRADEAWFQLAYHARLGALGLWETFDTVEAPPVPSHF